MQKPEPNKLDEKPVKEPAASAPPAPEIEQPPTSSSSVTDAVNLTAEMPTSLEEWDQEINYSQIMFLSIGTSNKK